MITDLLLEDEIRQCSAVDFPWLPSSFLHVHRGLPIQKRLVHNSMFFVIFHDIPYVLYAFTCMSRKYSNVNTFLKQIMLVRLNANNVCSKYACFYAFFLRNNSAFKWSCFIFFRVVKEEITDDDTQLPCFNGRVVSWVSFKKIIVNVLNVEFLEVNFSIKTVAVMLRTDTFPDCFLEAQILKTCFHNYLEVT